MPRLGDTLLKHLVTKETDHPESDIECAALTGSEKQISWATDIRASRMLVAKSGRVLFGALLASREQSEEFMICLQSIRRAHWWIETRTLGHGQFLLAALDEGFLVQHVTPPKDNATAHAVLEEALLAPSRVRGPIAEVSLTTGKVRVVLIEFDEDTNTLLKRCGYRWDAPAWTRPVAEDVSEHRASEIAVRLLAHGCPVRIFDEALRQRTVENAYEPESPRRVEVSTSAKYSTKFHLVWTLDEKPVQCKKAAQQLRGAKVFDDGAYVTASHFEEILDFAGENGFTITPEAQSLIEVEKGKLAGSVKVAARPKAGAGIPPQPALAPANGEIDADLLDN
ncbi:hypothetical protein A6M27_19945 [Acidithiobacillus thiooxidans]|uniref:Uncharacterized protein n=1 Tax=Acidithiobacillus thiooxidans TaxID=930 RepID=A0A1C2J4W1_ACITH|nr:hypothetical protein [Acidithiobacillus thiooxidans]OCX73331.1 hypothetical protein A6O24_11770 [Acidithiobacillus thiooxidans]OCX77304.1 hypothetical protein A6P07_00340 [Acidithiobacillus thiooxidans]OCX81127.1 hypothetical protein A6M27_19945 [Acidithiobacillus thiooxidans]OCX83276.1 hypothetical protein A6O26_07470 [Acidithiobacillus thiooxidans]OFC41087.1 hypothetical protein BAE47_18690 [Acidithiobacillus thiooxidans]